MSLELWKSVGNREAEARVLDSLAVTAVYQENYELAAVLGQQVLDLWLELGHRWGVGFSYLNLGVHAFLRKSTPWRPRTRSRPSPSFSRWVTLTGSPTHATTLAISPGRPVTGRLPRENYAASLEMFRDLGDRRSLCMVYEAVALLLAGSSPLDALRLVGAADALRQAIGSPRSAADGARIEDSSSRTPGAGWVATPLQRRRRGRRWHSTLPSSLHCGYAVVEQTRIAVGSPVYVVPLSRNVISAGR